MTLIDFYMKYLLLPSVASKLYRRDYVQNYFASQFRIVICRHNIVIVLYRLGNYLSVMTQFGDVITLF